MNGFCLQDNKTTPYTYYNSTCMDYDEFCGKFGLTAKDSTAEGVEVCHNDTITKQFSELYKR